MYHSQSTGFNYTKPNGYPWLKKKKKKQSFNYDQLYAVLSRAKSLLRLTIVGNLKNKFFKAHPNEIKEYETLRSASNDLIDKRSDSSQNLITLRKHPICL